jgi:CRISPR-associated protein Cas5/DevS
VCAFRPYASREYQDTYPVPTPSAVYGMLLSLLGEPPPGMADPGQRRERKERHRGAALALALDRPPGRSKVFRKLRRGGDLEDIRPDYQDLLLDVGLWVWVGRGKDATDPCLADRVRAGLANPATITRSGGLSLGESSYLVDTVSVARPPESAVFVVPDPKGFYSLPTWVDHSDSAKTVPRRFRIDDKTGRVADLFPAAWFHIGE